MKLIIGGAFQGKEAYALEHFAGKTLVKDFHKRVLEMLRQGIDPLNYVKSHLEEYRDKVILCEDISCGVVPVDPLMRQWREALGSALGVISRESDEVIRVFCGIGLKLK